MNLRTSFRLSQIFRPGALLLILGLPVPAQAVGPDYFPADYESSKGRFLNQARELRTRFRGVEIRPIPVGLEKLSVDSVYIPGQTTQKRLLILTSGTHGPEAYAGSALQALFVTEILPALDLRETGVLLIHALNPWGFKHHRRDTENNVNLNRNFDVSNRLFQTQNEEYRKLRPLLELEGRVQSANSCPASDLLVQMLLKKEVTQQSLTEAIGQGQYESPMGINFGGVKFEEQTVQVIDLLRRTAAPYQSIFHIDLHTGLGKRGVLHIMTKKEMSPESRALQEKLFDSTIDAGHYELTPPAAEGFYDIHGDYANILEKIFRGERRRIVGITAEFGTVGNGLRGKIVTINRLVLENQGHHHGYESAAVEAEVKGRYLELFNPSDSRWRERVHAQGRYLLDTVVRRFTASE